MAGFQSVPEPAIEFSMKWTDLFKAVLSIGVASLWCRKESDQHKIVKRYFKFESYLFWSYQSESWILDWFLIIATMSKNQSKIPNSTFWFDSKQYYWTWSVFSLVPSLLVFHAQPSTQIEIWTRSVIHLTAAMRPYFNYV